MNDRICGVYTMRENMNAVYIIVGNIKTLALMLDMVTSATHCESGCVLSWDDYHIAIKTMYLT